MNKDNLNLSNNSKHDNASFNANQKKLQKEAMRLRLEAQKNQKKLEIQIAKKIEEADKKEEKRKLKIKTKNETKNKKNIDEIPTISLDQFHDKKDKQKKESFFARLIRKYKENSDKKKKEKEEKKLLNSNLNKIDKKQAIEEKRRIKEAEKQKRIEEKKLKEQKKLEEKRRKEELRKKEREEVQAQRERKKEEIKAEETRKKEAIEAKKQEKQDKIRQKELEKQRTAAEKDLLNTNTVIDAQVMENAPKEIKNEVKNNEKELEKQKKLEEKQRKEELRKAKLKEKYELEAKKKKEKEDKAILLMTERKEKEKKLKNEREQARKERKEKALLIRKAQEENKAKEKSERKTLKEKASDWYNNLSFVKDRKNRREMQRQALLIDFEGADAVRSEEKIMYKYVAKNNETGKVETGYFAAFSKLDVHSFLLAENYEVYEITPQTNIAKRFSFMSPKFKAMELDFFLTQLSTFLKSGITLVESVKILSKQSKKKAHKNVYKSIIYELTMGENFSEALAKQGEVFPRLLINMVKTSELTGDLPETLDDMANYYRETDKTRKQMISAITYPAVVLIFAVVILIFMMVSVIPQFVSIYDDLDTGLPGITIAIIKASSFLKTNWIYLIIGIVIFIVIFIILFKTIKVFKSLVQTIVMNVPVIGKIIIYNEVTMFTKTFASLLNHNVYITDCMEVLSKITNNEVYKMMIFDTITNLARGEAISNSFKNHWAFPTIAYEMILTGEKTGQLGVMMEKVAEYYQDQHKNAVNQIKAFIEPVMIILLAAIVGVILLSVVLPMFDMYETLSSQV